MSRDYGDQPARFRRICDKHQSWNLSDKQALEFWMFHYSFYVKATKEHNNQNYNITAWYIENVISCRQIRAYNGG